MERPPARLLTELPVKFPPIQKAFRYMGIAVRSIILASIFSSFVGAQEEASTTALTPSQGRAISDLVGDFRNHFEKSQCPNKKCEVLVTNFVLTSEQSCRTCRILSGALAAEIDKQGNGVEVISRVRLQSFLEVQRIPSKMLVERDALKWLGSQFDASDVVFGVVESKNGTLLLRVRILRKENKGGSTSTGKELSASLPAENLMDGLDPSETFSSQLKPPPPIGGQEVYRYEKSRTGMSPPHCTYMPNPSYTGAAREAKASGKLLIDAIITTEGTVIEPRIIRGLPFGLNEISMETVKTWKCNPAVQDGVPIAVVVPFEMNFRLY
jgi:hypothetical protein